MISSRRTKKFPGVSFHTPAPPVRPKPLLLPSPSASATYAIQGCTAHKAANCLARKGFKPAITPRNLTFLNGRMGIDDLLVVRRKHIGRRPAQQVNYGANKRLALDF